MASFSLSIALISFQCELSNEFQIILKRAACLLFATSKLKVYTKVIPKILINIFIYWYKTLLYSKCHKNFWKTKLSDNTNLTHQSVWWSSITKSVLYLSFAEGTFALEPAATEFALWLKAGTFLEGDVGALMVVPCRTWIAKSGSWDGGAEPTSPCSSWRSCSSVSSPEKYVIHQIFNFH